MSADLVAFLTQRLDADEAIAHAATPGPWRITGDDREYDDVMLTAAGGTYVGQTSYDTISTTMVNSAADARHIARHDPARVLVDIQAKRAIIARLGKSGYDWPASRVLNDVEEDVLRLMAVVYADHPDFNPDWTP